MLMLVGTLLIAAALSYWLLRAPPSSKPRRNDEPEEYFQAILSREPTMSSWSGAEQGCTWTQTDAEVEVCAPMPEGARAKDVACRVLPTTLSLSIRGTSVVEGKLFRRVRHDDCDWEIEERAGARTLKLTLVKAAPTKGSQNWTQLVVQS